LRRIESNISPQNSTSRPRTRDSSRSDKPATACILTSLDDGNVAKGFACKSQTPSKT
jgi:hypothetical protein